MALTWQSGSAQIGALPTADATQEGKIFQYTGETDTSFTKGYFYECVEVLPATDPKTYEWKQKNVQDGGSGSGNAEFTLDTTNDFVTITSPNQGMSFQLDNADGVTITASDPGTYQNTKILATQDYVGGVVGDLTTLTTTDKTNTVSAINELKSSVDALGEPFRVTEWSDTTLNTTIVPCTSDTANTNLDKTVFTITGQEATDYQIVGMIAYQLLDGVNTGNRINAWPVCQFTGNGQTELHVRWMCGGTTNKVAKTIKAWVLLKHR